MKQYKFKINGKDFDVTVNSVEGKNASVTVNGAEYQVELDQEAPAAIQPATPAAVPKPAGAGVKVNSPMEGNVVDICVKPGDTVKGGQKVVVIESMKMEVEISATQDGTVTEILVHKGDHLVENQPVVTIA